MTREGTLSRMFAAGYGRSSVILGHVSGDCLLAICQTLTVILTTAYVFDLSLAGRVVPVVLTTLLMALVSLAWACSSTRCRSPTPRKCSWA